MASRTSSAPHRSKRTTKRTPSRTRSVAIVVGIVVIAAIAAVGIWWGVSASSNSSSSETPQPAALPDETTMGTVVLDSANLEAMRSFYVDAVGLDVLNEDAQQVTLGMGGEELLQLSLAAGQFPGLPTEAGLYHTAILYPDEGSLAAALMSLAEAAPQYYGGSADHAVSLAFYFSDPEGNGLELYVDTPRDEWVWEDGLVKMGAEPLDPNAFINEHLPDAPGESGESGESAATMGHVHLRVGDLDEARKFYADTLGFAVTAESDGALFYAAGGYHHHLATNTWNSEGAGQRPRVLGLRSFTVHVGGEAALAGVVERLELADVPFAEAGGVVTVQDPWGNTVLLRA